MASFKPKRNSRLIAKTLKLPGKPDNLIQDDVVISLQSERLKRLRAIIGIPLCFSGNHNDLHDLSHSLTILFASISASVVLKSPETVT